ncbi:ABC transporter ATP-binding protein [Methanosarcina sp. 2.H.T.1A.6]|uniref:ABC transporter ATP-binding protein n=1 Tax=unclassified Methanosarcina TaxID=2644672 RepID=UPI0006215DD8|nr:MULTISPECIES: ABC transporter ATP-binding protein [unclassified Methanosarcina]KKG14288.1 ABC transporter ATP-binding protein [Methanosarcina sp. 2.H.T.1A.3]KKG18425.1 ABC transporter ATP-binding protein [Methanosarcina sp. 2.H.T.1A.15]KKG19778.1 ABC transporter ATP-binding protein [Methanosarcina sp. 2.H.T.1A.6]KKG27165.1 ABC transporter ATP-binding protein [Methanosarcina sp. 2.H.T.1A.8]
MIRISNLVKDYEVRSDKIRVLDHIDLTVKDGEILGITGRSGSGKSTLLRIIRGVEPFDEGTVEVDGETVSHDSGIEGANFLKSVTAIHLQRNFGLWNGPAIENIIRKLNYLRVGHEALPHNETEVYDDLFAEAMEYMKLVGLEHKALHSTNLLSGGEKQRVVMARQLAAKPKVLLLDEPVTMTGPDTKQEVLDVIKGLKDNLNIPIIVVSHLPEIHAYLADRLIFLENGKIAAEGEPTWVLKNFLRDLKPREGLSESGNKEVCIKIRNISKRYSLIRMGEVLNIKDFSLDVYGGEILAFIGPSGAGKTTIMKLMEGLVRPKSGSVEYLCKGGWVDVTEYSKNRMELRRIMSVMNQEFSMSVNSTVREQIRFRLSIKKQGAIEYARNKAREMGLSDETLDTVYRLPDMPEEEKTTALRELNLNDTIYSELFPAISMTDVDTYAKPVFEALDLPMEVLDKTPYQISGGEHVRAFIALSLATSPEYLMLDEPFGDLDPVTLRDVTNSLKRINERFGTTIVLVSHHMDFVREVAHRAVLIENGALVMDGKPIEVSRELINRSNAPYMEHSLEDLIEGNLESQ